jgi:flagellar hook-associated protein 3 FlgL
MSISLNEIYQNTSWSIGQQTAKLSLLQEKASTGQETNRVSDNPTVTNQILGLTSENRTKEQYLNNMDELNSILELSSSIVQSMTTEMTQARTSMASVVSGTTSDQTRRTLATDLDNTLEQLVSQANTQRMGESLFAGSKTAVQPYTVERDNNGQITQVIYQGSMQENPVEISRGVTISAVLAGPSLFSVDNRQTPVFSGETGAAVGSGTSTVRGGAYLQVRGTTGNWELSIDGGQNWVASDGTEDNLAVVNSQTGETLYVDTTGITQVGTEPVRVPGTYDIFNVLVAARDLLNNTENLPEDQLRQMLSDTLLAMKDAEETLTRSFPVIGGRIQTISALSDSVKQTKLGTEGDISRMQDADIAQVSIDLARYETLYQMSLAVASKMFSMSFLEFMK